MENVSLFVLEMDYRPNNPNKPKYRCWAQTPKEARRFMEDKLPWLKIYSINYATKEDYERFTDCDYHIRLYTHNYIQYWHILKENGFL